MTIQERNNKLAIKNLQNKIQLRDSAIDYLRGYITFLEGQIIELKMNIGDYQD
jgi:hypothetical protein